MKSTRDNSPSPRIYARSEHTISRAHISKLALKVLYRLKEGGYEAYLVGGCVRDLLLGLEPKDFDVATDAHPEQVQKLFRNCRLIGRRFRLAHVYFGREIIEVATFRGPGDDAPNDDRVTKGNLILRDNVYGTLEEDAWRRDFTVNALYYNIRDFSLIDFVDGMADMQSRTLRLIGDPVARYQEDPVRMIRAIRFAAKLEFKLHPSCKKPINKLAPLLENIPSARLFDESLKLLLTHHSSASFQQLQQYHLFDHLFPETAKSLKQPGSEQALALLELAMQNTDQRLQDDKSVTPYFIFAALLWEPVRQEAEKLSAQIKNESMAIQAAADKVISKQLKVTSIPRRITTPMRELWSLQPRLLRRQGTRSLRLLNHPRFRAAYDFFVMRAEVGEADLEVAAWWTQIQQAPAEEQKQLTQTRHTGRRRNKRPRKRKSPEAT